MVSLEEDNLFEMVHDFLESESPVATFSPPSISPPLNDHNTKFLFLREVLNSGNDAEVEVLECVLKHMRSKIDAEKSSSLKKWLVMRLRRDGHSASLCQTSWMTTLGCPGGDYEYIDIAVKDNKDNSRRLIVDIDFNSQFKLARPTSTYKALSGTLPSIFVGDEHKLIKIISILSSAAKQSLRERGLHIPPWRTSTYMQSKWFSVSYKVPKTSSNTNKEVSIENKEAKVGVISSKFGKWAPPLVKPKRSDFNGRSGLSSQFSNMSTKCC